MTRIEHRELIGSSICKGTLYEQPVCWHTALFAQATILPSQLVELRSLIDGKPINANARIVISLRYQIADSCLWRFKLTHKAAGPSACPGQIKDLLKKLR
jgi:hypothetical protein